MSNFVKPVITTFGFFDATKVYNIEFTNTETADQYVSFSSIITNIATNESLTVSSRNIISSNVDVNGFIEEYPILNLTMIHYNNNYYLIIPENYCINGSEYSLGVSFLAENINCQTDLYPFKCLSDPKVKLENYVYQNGESHSVENNIFDITISKTFCTLNFSYSQDDGDILKYYQFYLYDNNGRELGKSKRIYSSSEIIYNFENCNNLQTYLLRLEYVSQSGNSKEIEYTVNTDYDQDNIYADIICTLDKETAVNNLMIRVTQLNGYGDLYEYDDSGEKVIISEDGYVEFIDRYKIIHNNFLCRLWCSNLINNTTILKIQKTSGSEYIDIIFKNNRFYAYKHSCDMVTSYVSNELDLNGSQLTYQNIYFAIGYYNGRIEMYTTITE